VTNWTKRLLAVSAGLGVYLVFGAGVELFLVLMALAYLWRNVI
jgi:hypothetical protein